MAVLYLLLLVATIQLFFWIRVFRFAYDRPVAERAGDEAPWPGVSVIVCFRNEADTLRNCVEGILAQKASGPYEVVLVDDNSTDTSVHTIQDLLRVNAHLRLLSAGPTRPGKKDALAQGIAAARFEHLLLTDADCVPAGRHWLERMTEPLREGKTLVLGVSPLVAHGKDALLDGWQYFESLYISLKYLGFAHWGRPYMGVGRNLAYTRSFYRAAGGFAAHAALASGDDDLLVSGQARPRTTARVVAREAWTYSAGQPRWRRYFRQRGRHQSTGIYYPASTGLLLGSVALSHGLFFLLGACLLFTPYRWWACGLYVLRWWWVWRAFAAPMREGAVLPSRSKQLLWVTLGDALLGPMYLFLLFRSAGQRTDW